MGEDSARLALKKAKSGWIHMHLSSNEMAWLHRLAQEDNLIPSAWAQKAVIEVINEIIKDYVWEEETKSWIRKSIILSASTTDSSQDQN